MSTVKLVVGSLAAAVLGMAATLSQAAPQPSNTPVTVTNVPLPVNITPVRYQESGGVNSNECAPQCILSFATVPAGKRLVLTHVSAQVGDVAEIVVIERANSGVLDSLFIPKPYPSSGYVDSQVSFYYEPGETPTARMFVTDAAARVSLIVTMVGYLIPAQ